MTNYEIYSIIISCFSALISVTAALAAFLPYILYKVKFKVTFNPFVKDKEDFDIKFSIINKRKIDLNIECLCASKNVDLQIFEEKNYPKVIKANSSAIFTINNSKLNFSSVQVSKFMKFTKIKPPKYINFYFIDSVRKERLCKIRYKDYENICEYFKVAQKLRTDTLKEEDVDKALKVLNYFFKRNKVKF